ncbi:MAG: hypothetical protein AUI09_01085 [Gemmatimonadetes bacterium 13_2_20CM_2_66_5]|nr:MAG: hypothetical protein AUI09_01085 [Gemmatimonadetes bacterium 13_2_20CM_2_66_5]
MLASGCTMHRDRVSRAPFGELADGRRVELFTLTNAHGIEVRAMTYGAIITSIQTPDRSGKRADIVLGFDSLGGYVAGSPYFGAVVGRYANRIARGQFTLDGATYHLARNNGPNSLHGGERGFDKVVWSGTPFQSDSTAGVTLRYESPDGEEGYPGAVSVQVTYTLTDADDLIIEYEASTTKATPINLSQHTYWNLHGAGDILAHVLTLKASAFTPVDSTLIPTGQVAPVAGTPFPGAGALAPAARLEDPLSGRTLDISTTEPGVQFYSGNFLDGTLRGKGGRTYAHRAGLCLETQHFPDSPNHANFPSTILRPGQRYHSRTVIAFRVTGS